MLGEKIVNNILGNKIKTDRKSWNNETCQHEYVPNVVETRKQNKGIWTCVKCSKNIPTEEALSYTKGE